LVILVVGLTVFVIVVPISSKVRVSVSKVVVFVSNVSYETTLAELVRFEELGFAV